MKRTIHCQHCGHIGKVRRQPSITLRCSQCGEVFEPDQERALKTRERNLGQKANRRGWILLKSRQGKYALIDIEKREIIKVDLTLDQVAARCCPPFTLRAMNGLARAAIVAQAFEETRPSDNQHLEPWFDAAH